jgi:UPF0755 protein
MILLVGVVLLALLMLDIYHYAGRPAGDDISVRVINVLPGQRFSDLAVLLNERGIITHPKKFKLFAQIKGYDKRIKAGEYRLSASLSPRQVLEIMVSGKVALHKFTIPEGFNIYQIDSIFAEKDFLAEKAFVRAASNPELVKDKGFEAHTFEGYLFPDTYYFPKGVVAEDIITSMVNRFREVFSTEWESRAVQLGMTVHQIVTLASIIEKETGAAFERPLISSVFHNRLKKRIRLSSDPTVIYGIKDFDGNITRKHLKARTPYNTYLIKGLPPGPIANPGIDSIEAALYPAETNYLYFVSKKDGTHHFSINIKDHNKAVRKYQLKR